MGYNTTVVVLNDALSAIMRDPAFGENLAKACAQPMLLGTKTMIEVPALNHVNAAHVIETHHADQLVPVLIGGNMGTPISGLHLGYRDTEVAMLKSLAEKHGYNLRPKRR